MEKNIKENTYVYNWVTLPTTQEKTLHVDITRRSIPKSDWLYSLQPKTEKLYTLSKTRPGADCGSDHELLIDKRRFKLKKVRKITRPFRYDLNQIPYNYTAEGRNKIQGIRSDRQSTWKTMDGCSGHCTWGRDQDHPQEKEMQKGKMVVWGGLTNSWEKKRRERQRR